MNDIERIKQKGAAKELSSRIDTLRFELTNNNWNGIKYGNRFSRLGEAINDAENLLKKMRIYLDALQKIEPGNQ